MFYFVKSFLKKVLFPIRSLLRRFISINDYSESLFYKAGSIVASDMIEGDYLEFGVYLGDSFSSAYHSIKKAYSNLSVESVHNSKQDCIDRVKCWENMRFFAFDSFQGLPKPSGVDAQEDSGKYFSEGKYAVQTDSFINNIRFMGVPLDRVKIVPGWFNESLVDSTVKKYNIKHAAIVHIDCDFYESTQLVLDFIKPLLVDGSIIIFDDWFTYKGSPRLGEQRAFKEWQDKNPEWIVTEYHKEGIWRNSFILNKFVN